MTYQGLPNAITLSEARSSRHSFRTSHVEQVILSNGGAGMHTAFANRAERQATKCKASRRSPSAAEFGLDYIILILYSAIQRHV